MLWLDIAKHIPKSARYTIGARIENKFLYLLELLYLAYFTEREKKVPKVIDCIFNLDTLKYLVQVAWEAKLIPQKPYESVALKLTETGKMLGGWKGHLENPDKKNRAL